MPAFLMNIVHSTKLLLAVAILTILASVGINPVLDKQAKVRAHCSSSHGLGFQVRCGPDL